MTSAVVFGGGALGYTLARELVARGTQVKVASRSGKAEAPSGAGVVKADASDAAQVKQACSGVDVVYFCAAPPYTEWPDLYPPMQRGLVDGVGAAGARLVTAENVYVYGKATGPMTEDTPWSPVSKKGEIRAKLNQDLLDAHKAGKVQVALGRAPDYYGPRATLTTIYGYQVYPNALVGKPANVFGDLDALHTWIYATDFARGLITLGENPSSMGQVWHLPCPPPMTQRMMLELIYKAAGHPMKARTLPKPILKLLALFVPIMRELAEMEYQWRMTFDFRHDKFDKAFKLDVTPHEVGVRETLDWYRTSYKA
jgi:nucleoside-diphosphate-sugar epimerase